MKFNTKHEVVFLKADSGVFANENGEKVEWTKIMFADPVTYENHDLAFKPDLDFSKIDKGQKILLELQLEPTKKKSRVIVTDYNKVA